MSDSNTWSTSQGAGPLATLWYALLDAVMLLWEKPQRLLLTGFLCFALPHFGRELGGALLAGRYSLLQRSVPGQSIADTLASAFTGYVVHLAGLLVLELAEACSYVFGFIVLAHQLAVVASPERKAALASPLLPERRRQVLVAGLAVQLGLWLSRAEALLVAPLQVVHTMLLMSLLLISLHGLSGREALRFGLGLRYVSTTQTTRFRTLVVLALLSLMILGLGQVDAWWNQMVQELDLVLGLPAFGFWHYLVGPNLPLSAGMVVAAAAGALSHGVLNTLVVCVCYGVYRRVRARVIVG